MALLLVLLFQSVCIGFFGCFVFDISIQKYYNNRCKHIGGVEMSYQKKVNETLYRGTSRWLRVSQDYVPKEGEDVIETDDIVKKKKFLASVLRLHI